MRRELRPLWIVVLATLLLAGCGDNDNTIVIDDNGNDNTSSRTATPVAVTPTVVSTPQQTATEIVATETPEPGATETPAPEATETPDVGPTSTSVATAAVTITPTAGLTASPTPAPTSTAAGPFCGNGVKETGEDCDSGTVFSSNADCAEQCACCRCRPDSVHASVPMTKCSTCHPAIAPALTFPPGAATTFPGLCE